MFKFFAVNFEGSDCITMNPAPRSNRFTQRPLHAVREMLAVDSSAPGWSQRPWGVDGDSIKGLGWGGRAHGHNKKRHFTNKTTGRSTTGTYKKTTMKRKEKDLKQT